MTQEEFIRGLLRQVPELVPLYRQHIIDNDILLPHVLMGDITREILLELEQSAEQVVVRKVLDFLETELNTGSPDVRALVRASFIENLLGESDALAKLRICAGPHLAQEIEAICGN